MGERKMASGIRSPNLPTVSFATKEELIRIEEFY